MHADGRKRRLTRLLKKSFWRVTSAAALLVLSYGTYLGWRELSKQQWHVDCRYLLPSFGAYSIVLAIVVVNWNSIVKSLGISLGFRRNMKLYCYTNLTKHLPSALWFVGTRLYLYQREGVAKGLTSMGVSLELTLLTSSNLIVCLAVLPLYPILKAQQVMLGVAILIPLLIITFYPRLLLRTVNFFRLRFNHAPLTVVLERKDMLLLSATYSAGWIVGGMFLYLLIMAIHPSVSSHVFEVIGAWVLSALVSRLRFVLPIGVGWREVTLAAILSSFMPLSTAVVVSVLSKIWLALSEVVWLLISFAL